MSELANFPLAIVQMARKKAAELENFGNEAGLELLAMDRKTAAATPSSSSSLASSSSSSSSSPSKGKKKRPLDAETATPSSAGDGQENSAKRRKSAGRELLSSEQKELVDGFLQRVKK